MKTKQFPYVLIGMLYLALGNAYAQVAPSITVGDNSGDPGDSVEISMTWNDGGDPSFLGVGFEVDFDPAILTFDSCTLNAPYATYNLNICRIVPSDPEGDLVEIGLIDNLIGPGPVPSGVIGTLVFTIDGLATPGTTDLALLNPDIGGGTPTLNDGSVTINEPPQPDWSSSPTSTAGLDFGSHTTGTGIYPLDLTVTNAGQAGSTLTGSCDVSGSAVFGISGDNTLGAGLAPGASADITVVCDTTSAAVQLHTGTMSCTHNGDGTTETSITDYALSCNVTATPEPSFLGVDNGLTTMDVVEEGDADATATLTVSNNGNSGTTLIGSCVYAGDTEIAVSNGTFALAQGDPGQDVLATCSGAAEGTYTGTLTCGPTDPQTWVAADSPYAVSCTVGPPGDAVYSSVPAPGAVIDMTTPGEPVPVGATVPDQDLVITNDAPEPNDRALALLSCDLNSNIPVGAAPLAVGAISATAAVSPLAPMESTTVTFSCDTSVAGDYTDTYSCSYDVDGDGAADGTANYTVNCAIREAESEVTPTPADGTTVTIYAPLGLAGQGSVMFNEVLDEDEDGTLNDCYLDDETYFSILTPASFPQTISSGASVEVLVEGMGTPDGEPTSTTLYCDYTDSQSESTQVSWPLEVVTQTEAVPVPVPTLSTWGLMLMILTLLGLGGLVIRRKEYS